MGSGMGASDGALTDGMAIAGAEGVLSRAGEIGSTTVGSLAGAGGGIVDSFFGAAFASSFAEGRGFGGVVGAGLGAGVGGAVAPDFGGIVAPVFVADPAAAKRTPH